MPRTMVFGFVKGLLRRRVAATRKRPTRRLELERLEDRTVPSTVTGLSPNFGPTGGGTEVQITGSAFTGATGVEFGGSSVYEYSVVSDTVIDAWAPSEGAGVVDVTVTAPSGTSPHTSADLFTFQGTSYTDVFSSANPSNPGQAVTFTAQVGPNDPGDTITPTGTVTFKDGTTTLGTATLGPGGETGDQAMFTTSALTLGSHTITAVYNGDALYAGSNSYPLTQMVQDTGAYIWTGDMSSHWTVAANWLVHDVTATTAPGSNSDVIFSGVLGSDAACTTDGAVSVKSVSMDASYTGDLTLVSAMNVAAGFDLEGGNINQANGAASDISVMGAFNWTGGVLNFGNQLSDLFLNNSVTLTGTNLTTGANFILNGAILHLANTGNLTFNNNAGVTLSHDALFALDSPTVSIVTLGTGTFQNNGGTLSTGIRMGNNRVTCDLPYDGTAGILDVTIGTLAFTKTGSQNDSVYMSGGSIIIGNLGTTATLEVDQTLTMKGGQLITGNGVTAKITVGDVNVLGDARIMVGDLNGIGELDCDGLVTMNGGTYIADVDLKSLKYSTWHSAKGFNIGGAAALEVDSLNIPAVLPKNQTFMILATAKANSIVGDFPAANKDVSIGMTGKSYQAAPDAASPNQFYDLSL